MTSCRKKTIPSISQCGCERAADMLPREDDQEQWNRFIPPPKNDLPTRLMEDDPPSPTTSKIPQVISVNEALRMLDNIKSPPLSPTKANFTASGPSTELPQDNDLRDTLMILDEIKSPAPVYTGSEESTDEPSDDHNDTMVISTPAATLAQESSFYVSPVSLTTGQPQLLMAQGSSLQAGVGGLVDVPTLTDMEGKYGFTVSVDDKERSTKSPMWLMSTIVNKLYTNLNKAVPFEVRLTNPPKGTMKLFIRAVVVFSSPEFLRTNVTRCPNHAAPSEATNHDFPYPNHVVRADHPAAHYQVSASGRLSVAVPLDLQQSSPEYALILLRFMCLGSCVGGISRRPISIVLTLENGQGDVLGRKVIDVRVCACPTRDIKTDEQAVSNKGIKRKGSTQPQQVVRKKPKIVESRPDLGEGSQEVFNIKVHGRQLYTFMMDMMRVYYSTHPDYAQQHPDPALTATGSTQRQKSPSYAKEKLNRAEQAEESHNASEKSASNSPIHDGNLVIDSQEGSPCSTPSHLQHLHNSVPATVNVMVMNSEINGIDSVVKSNAHTPTLNVAYPTLSSVPLLSTSTLSSQVVRILPSQATAKALVSTPQSDNSSSSNGSITRHIPVMQVTREPFLRRGNSDSKIVKHSRAISKNSNLKSTMTTAAATTTTIFTGVDASSQEEGKSSPGSKEMLAANVLAERFT